MELAEKIVNARKKAGLDQKELGRLLGLSERTVGMYENGEGLSGIKHITVIRYVQACPDLRVDDFNQVKD